MTPSTSQQGRQAGPTAPGGDQDLLRTPQQRGGGGAGAPSAADLAHWDSTPQAEFLELANAVIKAYRDRYGADVPTTVPAPPLHGRASAQFRDSKQLQPIFNRSLSLTEKVLALRGVAASAVASAAVHKSRTTGSIGSSLRSKRQYAAASKASGRHGVHAYNVGKRSPHVKGAGRRQRSPPPSAAAAIDISVRRSITQAHDDGVIRDAQGNKRNIQRA